MTVYYHPDYVAAAHVFTTTRKPAWMHDNLTARPLPGLTWAEPAPVTVDQLSIAHTGDYIEAVRTGRPPNLAGSNGFPWDRGIWTAATRSVGGVVAAALEAYRSRRNTGSLSSGLHHARRAQGSAFCTFNGLALAAHAALADGAQRVLILDLDAHGGGGTRNIIAGESRILHVDIATNTFDRYTATAPSTYNYIRTAERYLPLISQRLEEAWQHGDIDLCLYNAGVDSHENDPGGGLTGITTKLLRKRESLVFNWARTHGIPVTFVLAGGYPGQGHDQATVVALHHQTVQAALTPAS